MILRSLLIWLLLGPAASFVTPGYRSIASYTHHAIRRSPSKCACGSQRFGSSFVSLPIIGRSRSTTRISSSRKLSMINGKAGVIAGVSAVLVAIVAFSFFAETSSNNGRGGPTTVRVVLDDGTVAQRGIMTSLTRNEIQKKLAQLPVFYISDPTGSVHVVDGKGSIYLNPDDAQNVIKEVADKDLRVGVTTLDDLWYPLITKKGEGNSEATADAGAKSDVTASYTLVPYAREVEVANESVGSKEWQLEGPGGDVPLWSADRLAFNAQGGRVKIPFFVNRNDLAASWGRLQAKLIASDDTLDDKQKAEAVAPALEAKITSLRAVLRQMERGGTDARKIEFYPTIEAVDQAEKLFSD